MIKLVEPHFGLANFANLFAAPQVVPLYSALFSGVNHPGILRAVYIDSDAFRTSDFLANLVVFSARLRNAGLSDHDLVYHISEALAGALTGVGHSKIYEEEEVFK